MFSQYWWKTLDVTEKANRCGTQRWKQWEEWGQREVYTNKERIKEVKVAWMTDGLEKNKCFRVKKA